MTFLLEDIFGATKKQRDALGKSRRDGYLVVPTADDDPHLQTLYSMDRHLRGLTGVILYPGEELRTTVAAICLSPELFERLLKTAEQLGVEVEVRKPERGYLLGSIDNELAHEVAEQLAVLSIAPDLTASHLLSFVRQICRHWPQSKGV